MSKQRRCLSLGIAYHPASRLFATPYLLDVREGGKLGLRNPYQTIRKSCQQLARFDLS
jgi:hypothetical protein